MTLNNLLNPLRTIWSQMDSFERSTTFVYYCAIIMGSSIFIFFSIKLCPTIGCEPIGVIATSITIGFAFFLPLLIFKHKHHNDNITARSSD